jgi:putative nucleotidyltransferase with HDIG domain
MNIPEKVLDGIQRLEPLPITVQKLLVTLHDENVNFNEITEAIQYDGAITANILRTANSAAFGGRTRIEHTRDAVVRLGTVTLLDILLIGHLRTMKTAAPLYSLSEDDFWLHSASASLAVKAVVKESRNRKIPEPAAIAALIHDIGKLVMARYLNAEPAAIRNVCEEKNFTFVEAEKELFGCDHAEVGSIIAQKWAFPDQITHAIAQHHAASVPDPDLMLDAVVLANVVANSIDKEPGTARPDCRADVSGAKQRIGITDEGFDRVCAQTSEWVADLKTSYGIRK